MKFNPSYSLSVETLLPDIGGKPANVVIELPITCEFEIRRAALASSQTATFRLYNLGQKTRDLLQKDWFNALADVRAIQFRAGYEGSPTTMIFNGTLKQAQSCRRPGAVDMVTEIEAFDGGAAMANGFSLRTIAAGTQFTDLIKNLAKDLPGLAGTAAIGKMPGATKRGATFVGNTWNYIFQLSNGLAVIDDAKLKILNPNEYITADIPEISSAAGLVGTPMRYLNMMRVQMLFEPNFTIGQLVNLNSSTLTKFNGVYKVMGIMHRGLISHAKDGERRTELTLWNGLGNSDSWSLVGDTPIQ